MDKRLVKRAMLKGICARVVSKTEILGGSNAR